MGWWIGSVVVIAVIVILMYNHMVGHKNRVEFAFSGVDTMLKQRYDLIPNLVAVCEKYMGYEAPALREIVAARSAAMQAPPEQRPTAEAGLTGTLKSLFALAENYPDLKASEQLSDLQRSLNEVEEQIAASRRAYNARVVDYNNACEMFPTNLMAMAMGYRRKPVFEIPAAEREPVKVWRT